jgi:hypothetical protein
MMDKLRVLSVVLLGMAIAGTSGMSMARTPSGGSVGASKPAPHGGSGGYTRPDGYHRPPGDYHRPPGDYYKHDGHGGHGGHGDHDDVYWSFGFYANPFYYAPWYYPGYYPGPYYYPPYYYPPGVVTVPTEPPEYIERDEAYEEAPRASAYWYYCTDPQGYYPYVKQCKVGWQPVAPRPPDAPAEGR